MRWLCALVATSLLLPATASVAQEEPEIELEIPVVITDPRDGTSAAGFGDLAIENKFLLWESVEHRALVAAGFELTLPSGSERRGLGGAFAVEPFVSAGIALGPFDLLGN